MLCEAHRKPAQEAAELPAQPRIDAKTACLECAGSPATYSCEHCQSLTYCQGCLWKLRKKARKLHDKTRGSQGSERFPELPRCTQCAKPTRHVMPLADGAEESDPDVLLGAGLAFLEQIKAGDPLDHIEKRLYFRRILSTHGLSDNIDLSEREASLAKVWCRRVRKNKHAPWEVFQAALSGDPASKPPHWACDPAGQEQRKRPSASRQPNRRLSQVFGSLDRSLAVCF